MQHHRDRRKIDPSRGPTLPDGSPNDNDRVEIGPTRLALGEWGGGGRGGRPTSRPCAATAGSG